MPCAAALPPASPVSEPPFVWGKVVEARVGGFPPASLPRFGLFTGSCGFFLRFRLARSSFDMRMISELFDLGSAIVRNGFCVG